MARPLTKKKKTGESYTRPDRIEARIDAVLALGIPQLRQLLQVTDRKSPDYLPSECLVHLIRDAIQRGDLKMADVVLPVLLTRCEAILKFKIRDSSRFDAATLREEVLNEFATFLATESAADNSNELDYFECKFHHAFRTLRIDVVRKETACWELLQSLPEELAHDDETTSAIPKTFQIPPTQHEKAVVREILDGLHPEVRQAAVLCWLLGYEVESTNEEEITAATICGVSGRMIRYRLRIAKHAILRVLKGERI